MENQDMHSPKVSEAGEDPGFRIPGFRLAKWLFLILTICALPLWQPLAAITVSPLVASIYLFAKFKRYGYLSAFIAFLAGLLLVPAYAAAMLTFVMPASYDLTVVAYKWAPVVALMIAGSILSLVIWMRSGGSSLRSHVTEIGAVWVLVPAATGLFWAAMYLVVLPFVTDFHKQEMMTRLGTLAGVLTVGATCLFLMPRIYHKALSLILTGAALAGLTFLQETVWETWFIMLLILTGTALLLVIWHFSTLKLSSPVRKDALAWVMVMAIVSWFWHVNVDRDIVEWQTALSLNPEKMTTLPDSSGQSYMRILARSTAHTYITNNTYPQIPLKASHPHLIMGSDRLYWQSHFHIDTAIGRLCDSVRLIVRMDADETTQRAESFDKTDFPYALFPCSSESWVFQGVFKSRHPFSTQGNHIYWQNADKTWSALVPYTSLKPTILGTMVPYPAGVMEVTQQGMVFDHSIKEAASKFAGAVFFPPELARELVQSYVKWHGGFIGRGITETGELAMSEEDEDSTGKSKDDGHHGVWTNELMKNQFPFLQKFEGLDNLQEVFQLEPAAKDNFGLVEVLFFDAITGKVRVWQNLNDSLTGPSRAGLQVRNADPDMGNWEDTARVEPKLIKKEGRGIYHFYTVVTHNAPGYKDGSYVTSVLVNAKNGAAWRIQTAEQLTHFLSLKEDPKTDEWLYTVVRPSLSQGANGIKIPAPAPTDPVPSVPGKP